LRKLQLSVGGGGHSGEVTRRALAPNGQSLITLGCIETAVETSEKFVFLVGCLEGT
jgi:hypothetical protein